MYGFCDFIQETVEMQKKWGSVTCLFGELFVILEDFYNHFISKQF